MAFNILRKYDTYYAIICICFYLSGMLGYTETNAFFRMLIFPLLIIYCFRRDPLVKKRFVLSFLILFGLGEICYYFIVINYYHLLFFSVGNTILILGYTSLIALIISGLNIKQVIKRFHIQIIVLAIMGIYLFLKLNSMIEFRHTGERPLAEYTLNIIYNMVIVLVLGLALLNYFYHDSTIALKLLIACTLLIFSEFVQTAFYFMGAQELLENIYNALLAFSYFTFFLYIKESKVKQNKNRLKTV